MRGAIVTGAGSGIGAACVRQLASHGYGVVLSGRRPDPLEEVATGLDPPGIVVPGDVGDPQRGAEAGASADPRSGDSFTFTPLGEESVAFDGARVSVCRRHDHE